MSDDFATLVNKLNEMSEDNYTVDPQTNTTSLNESADDMRGILDRFNKETKSDESILAQKGNIKLVMTESH